MITIPTRNRPLALVRAIRSYHQNARRFDRIIRFLIIDDSDDATASVVREALTDLSRTCGIQLSILSRRDRAASASVISRKTGLPQEVVSYAMVGDHRLHPTSFGACRNSAYLSLKGECFISVDDDTICRTYRRAGVTDDITVKPRSQSGQLPGEHKFHRSLAEAQRNVEEVDEDFIGLHEEVLGMITGSGRVVLSNLGVVGDCAAEWSGYFLFLEPRQRAALFERPDAFNDYMSSRQITLSVDHLVLWNGPVLRGMNMGVDARAPLPPFLSVDRGEDHLFGMVLQFVTPASLTALQPLMLLHDPPENRAGQPWWNPTAPLIRPLTITKALLMSFQPMGVEPAYVLRQCGDYLVQQCRESLADFSAGIADKIRKNLANKTEFLTRLGEDNGHSLIRPHLDRLIQSIGQARESLDAPEAAPAWEMARSCVRLYGEVLQHWHEIARESSAL